MIDTRLYQIPILNQKPLVDVSVWACQNRYMNNISEMFSYNQTPFFKEPASYMSDIATTGAVILKTPAQIGKTTCIENMFGWICEYDRANTMLVLDTQKSGEKMSKNRIRPFLRDVCGINNPRNTTNKGPDKSNSVMNIGLGRGANLLICSAKSASDLRSTPVKYLLMDELDAWPDELKGEGDPVLLALQRQMRFRGMAVMTSTPTDEDGRIYKQYTQGTMQSWVAVCECGQYLYCKWKDIQFDTDTPYVICPKCGQILSQDDVKCFRHIYTEPANLNAFKDEYKRVWRSYEIPGTLCHEFYTWDGLKRAEQQALALGESSYQSFVNTRLGDIYTPSYESQVEQTALQKAAIREYKPDESIPDDVAFIVIGLDTHDSCLYCETVGVSDDLKRYYGLDYRVLPGDPNDGKCWELLNEIYKTEYTRDDGVVLKPLFGFGDSGGHRTNAVYKYAALNRRFMPVKGFVSGDSNKPDPLLRSMTEIKLVTGIKKTIKLYIIGVNAGKDMLLLQGIETVSGNNSLNYPVGFGYDDEYFNGLLSEKRVDGKWIATKKYIANEPLDCRVYALACAEYYFNKYYITGKDPESRGVMGRKKKIETSVEQPKQELKQDEKQEVNQEVKQEKPKKKAQHW